MNFDRIKIKGARVNNLKNVDLELPVKKLICFFGPSGSGKTSLAFQTLYSESKRRFLNSFPTYLKFFSDRPSPVDVDEIYPVLPVFGLPQNNPVVGTRSNVADIMHLTELYQNIFYHYSKEKCPIHETEFREQVLSDYIKDFIDTENGDAIYHLLISKDDFIEFYSDQPFPSRSLKSTRSKKITEFDQDHSLWEIGRFKSKQCEKLTDKFGNYFEKSHQIYLLDERNKKLTKLNFKKGEFFCTTDGCSEKSVGKLGLTHFSPYNALGACDECSGFGETLDYDEEKLFDENKSVSEGGVLLLQYKRFAGQQEELEYELKKKKISLSKPIKDLPEKFFTVLYDGAGDYYGFNHYFKYLERKRYKMNVRIFIRNIQKGSICPKCEGTRMMPFSRNFFFQERSLFSLLKLNISETYEFFAPLAKTKGISKEEKKSINKIISLLQVACGVGLGHLSLARKAKSLSAGEYQRLLLLKYLSYDGKDTLFVFDEPSLGLSKQEKSELLKGFHKLIEQGNTVVLIDHSKYFRAKSDYLVEMGPGSGSQGGEVIFSGDKKSYKEKIEKHSLKVMKPTSKNFISVAKPSLYGSTFSDFKLGINQVNLVQGPSGTGKSASMINVLANKLHYDIYQKYLGVKKGTASKITYKYDFSDVIVVDANLNRYTSRSSVGSLTDLFPVVRKHFTNTFEARALGLKDGHFSYNSNLGQCPNCEGRGYTVVEMQFLEDIILTCEDCNGKRLKPIYADVFDGNFTVHEAYSRPLSEVLEKVRLTPKFQRVFEYLKILNLDYLSLNRSIQSLSGGEKQRIYLLSKLQKNLKDSIIFFENISFGLSDKELVKVCEFLQTLCSLGNTVVVIDQDEIFQNIAQNIIKFK